jgi:hypothetical protein
MILYKYVDFNLKKILNKSSLKFSSRDNLNDPFELFPFFEPNDEDKIDLLSEIGEEDYQENFLKSLPEDAFNIMSPSDWLVLEKNTRGQENPYQKEDPINWKQNYSKDLNPGFIKILNNTFGILSLTEDPLNINMWAHYGDSNRGFVLGFETDNDFFFERTNQDLYYRNLRKVNYFTERPLIKDPYNPNELNKTFFCKSIDWKSEKEWRVLRRLDDANEIIEFEGKKLHLYEFDPKIVKEIYFGLSSDVEIRKEIINLVLNNKGYKDIKFYQIELDDREFKLIPKLLNI